LARGWQKVGKRLARGWQEVETSCYREETRLRGLGAWCEFSFFVICKRLKPLATERKPACAG